MAFVMAIIKYNDLSEIREQHRDKKIVFCSGTFDLPHAGHVLFFEDCKRYGEILVVALGVDELTREFKGEKRPILNEHIRLKTVDSFKPVDYSLLVGRDYHSSSYPLSVSTFPKLFDLLKPNKWVVNKDAQDIPMRHELANRFNVELIVLERYCPREFEDISTTKLIEKIRAL